jgi:Fe-S cluster assembly protein SufD
MYTELAKHYLSLMPKTSYEWLKTLQLHTLNQIQQLGIPTLKDEEWRYTSLAKLFDRPYMTPKVKESKWASTEIEKLKKSFPNDYFAIFHNGIFQTTESHLPKDTPINDLHTALTDQTDFVQSSLNKSPALTTAPFSAINLLLLHQGIVIELQNDIDFPLHLVTLCDDECETAIRHLISLSENTNLTLNEHHIGKNNTHYFCNTITEITLQKNARLAHYQHTSGGNSGNIISGLHVNQKENSEYFHFHCNHSGLLARQDCHIDLSGKHAECSLNGLYILNGTQHADNHLYVTHKASHTKSNQFYKGIINSQGHGVFNGAVKVEGNLTQIVSTQMNNNLLLSNKAEIDTKPQLEIYSDDIICSHGATIGELDEEALFYLQSRGIPLEEAKQLLILAFMTKIVDVLPDKSQRNWIKQKEFFYA